jgi:hypothetical protein
MGNPVGFTGVTGTADGALDATNATLLNTLLAANSPSNCTGVVIDAGHNLSSDPSCAFTGPASGNNTDPKIGALTYNGGPTLTIPLLPGSPAIDAGDPVLFPPVDQRGFARPLGFAPDIGAYEFGLPVKLQANLGVNGRVDIEVFAAPGQTCRLFWSPDLLGWLPLATTQVSAGGIALFHDDVTTSPQRFYRAVVP